MVVVPADHVPAVLTRVVPDPLKLRLAANVPAEMVNELPLPIILIVMLLLVNVKLDALAPVGAMEKFPDTVAMTPGLAEMELP